ncbi:MAG: hypothetical protein KGL39_23650, partial [Patescibacteria group bacterium]|nr:hypothetical protein [Patescibacteria group bacterium]
SCQFSRLLMLTFCFILIPSSPLPHRLMPRHSQSENPGITKERYAKPDLDREVNDKGEVCARSFAFPLTFYVRKGLLKPIDERVGNHYAALWRHGTMRNRFAQSKYDERFDTELHIGFDEQAAILYKQATSAIRSIKHRKLALDVCCLGIVAGRGNIVILKQALKDLRIFFKKNT